MNKQTSKTRGAVIVTRVSGQEQAKAGTSLESQLEACRAKALALSLPIVAEYEDAAISGAFLLSRQGMQAAIADLQAGRADTLICFNIDRYSRDREHQEQIKKTVRAAGGRLVFTDAEYSDNAAGNLNFNIRGDFAVFEREHFRERSMLGKRERLENGNQISRKPPYGYHIPTKADILRGTYPPEQLGKYLLVEEQATVARWIFESYASGSHSLSDLAQEMYKRGVPAPKGGQRWRVTTFQNLFSNPVYKGEPIGGRWQSLKSENRLGEIDTRTGRPRTGKQEKRLAPPENWVYLSAPAIVDAATWERVQERSRANKAKRGGHPNRVRLLSGLLFCPQCGSPLQVKGTESARTKSGAKNPRAGGRYYQCGLYRKVHIDTGQAACTARSYWAERLEDAAIRAVLDACQRPDMIEAALAEYTRARATAAVATDPRKEMAALSSALNEIEQQESAAVQAQIAGIRAGASPDAYASVFADLAAQRKDMEDRRGVLKGLVKSAGEQSEGKQGGLAGRKAGAREEARREEMQRVSLEDARLVLTSPLVSTDQKRKIIGTLVDKVIPHPATEQEPARTDVHWVPNFFRESNFSENGEEDTVQKMESLRICCVLTG